jgi:hypothetical protein
VISDKWKENVKIVKKKLMGVDARFSEAGSESEDWAGMAPEYKGLISGVWVGITGAALQKDSKMSTVVNGSWKRK